MPCGATEETTVILDSPISICVPLEDKEEDADIEVDPINIKTPPLDKEEDDDELPKVLPDGFREIDMSKL